MNVAPRSDQILPDIPAKVRVLASFLGQTLYYCMIWAGLYLFMLVFGCSGQADHRPASGLLWSTAIMVA